MGDSTSTVLGRLTQAAVSILLNNGNGNFSEPEIHAVPMPLLGHRLLDLDGDGFLDLTAFSVSRVLIYPGRAAPGASLFRRGDPDGDGKIGVSDAIQVLSWLFRGGPAPSCLDAADANDDGLVNLTDPIRLLQWLFQGGEPLPVPGPIACGEDPTPDNLPRCTVACR